MHRLFAFATLTLLLFGTTSGGAAATSEVEPARIAAGREATAELTGALKQVLQQKLAADDPAAAITACSELAPRITGRISRQRGWRVTRVSLKPRNPLLGTPDAWEQAVLQQFDARAAAGRDPALLEHAEVVEEPAGRFFRYMKALPVGGLCLTCHGPSEQQPQAIRQILDRQYPHDRATGYAAGQIRGAVSVKQPLP